MYRHAYTVTYGHKCGVLTMDGLFHGKSENKMDDLGVPPFRKSPYTLDVAEMKIPTDQIGYRP